MKYRFRKRIISSNIAVIVVLIICLSGIAFAYLVQESNANFKHQVDAHTASIASQIESAIKIADETALQIGANDYIIQTFQNLPSRQETGNYFSKNPVLDGNIKKYMLSYMIKSGPINRICLFNEQRDFVFVGNAVDYSYVEGKSLEEGFVQRVALSFVEDETIVQFHVYKTDPLSSYEWSVFSVNREIKDYLLLPSKAVGYVQVQIPISYLARSFSILSNDMTGYLIDTAKDEKIFTYGKNNDLNVFSGKGEYISEYVLKNYGLRVVVAGNNIMVRRYIQNTLLWMILLIVSIIIFVAFGQIRMIRYITQPIVDLCERVEGLPIQNDPYFSMPELLEGTGDELQNLSRAFNTLAENLQDSMARQMGSQIKELEAKMFALQSQMDPHFIHNLLSIISMMATESEWQSIPPICEKLSEMIRYHSVYDMSFVTLQEEMTYAENYLELMKIRYENQFVYHVGYMGNIGNFRVPKFIIQPIIENAFQHGLQHVAFQWQIDLTLFAGERGWEVEVRDNGSGIAPDERKRLLSKCARIREKPFEELMKGLKIGGLSLPNIYARLFMAYGDNMLFDIAALSEGFSLRLGGTYD